MAPCDTSVELARRAVAQILLAETAFGADELGVLAVLAELLSLVVLKALRLAGEHAFHANRVQFNVFDVRIALPRMRTDASRLAAYLLPRQGRTKAAGRQPAVVPPGRCLLRSLDDDEDDDDAEAAKSARPAYLVDVYPSFPRPYTFRHTETRGIRESDKVLIAKAKAEQQRQIEQNLYRLLEKKRALSTVVNYEEE